MTAPKGNLVSMVDGLPVRPSGTWIERKHFFLRRYMEIFTKGMGTKWETTYIDLFAGPGRCLIEPLSSEKDGSPLFSLEYGFSKYIFVEKDSKDLEALKTRCKGSPKFSRIEFLHGNCNEIIDQIRPTGLTLAFVDPTGIDIHFETLRKLTEGRKVDMLLNIQFGMDIKRNFTRYKKQGDSSDLGQFLGGNIPWPSIRSPQEAMKLYMQKIGGLGYGTTEWKNIVVRNTKRNVPMYFLCFASRHSRGLDFWKKITMKDEQGQLEMFS